jgi:aspartate aminotransferase
VATFVQDAGVAALTGPRQSVETMVAGYRDRRDQAVPRLQSVPQLDVRSPEGAFYLFVDIAGTHEPDDVAFSTWALERTGVSLVPGSSFGDGGEHHVRIALTTTPDVLATAVDRLATALQEETQA